MRIDPPILPLTIRVKIEKIVNKIISLYKELVQKRRKSMKEKKWYQSKLVWLGVIMTISGAIEVVRQLLVAGPIDPQAILGAVGGIMTVIMRVWFTDTQIK